jgi:hypothetical protein
VALLGLVVGSKGAAPLAGLLLLTAVGLGLYARHWLSLAGRSRMGARSEDEVQGVLAPLRAEGWRLRHSLRWQGRGDIDAVAMAPTAVSIVIETKTRTYDGCHVVRVHEQAVWLSRRRRRWCRHGALAVSGSSRPLRNGLAAKQQPGERRLWASGCRSGTTSATRSSGTSMPALCSKESCGSKTP